ncbi:RTA1 like protein-domain-containing protein [Aspergillus cavernicola]|uniref:RTA1 like protein-domain-containing protein n=1 Tax=Aspergillus cavernicola TaxID=176166 RepID=A0ABR4HUA3_9EURO
MEFTFYYYSPSAAAAGIFVGLFGVCTLLHIYQLIRTRTWFMIPFAIGGIMEVIGYVGRLLSSTESPDWTQGPYIMQSALILIAPAFLAASIYMILGRIIVMLDAEKCSIIRLRFLTKLFVAGDVLSFLMQASGAGIMVKDDNSADMGEKIIVGGLFVQIIFFSFFVVTAAVFELRMANQRIVVSDKLRSIWSRQMMALCFTSVLILIRSIVRVVEYLMGYDSYLMKQEVFIYVFDALFMFIVLLTLNWIHPSQVNCELGRAEKYFDNIVQVREFVPAERREMESREHV